MNIYDIKNKQCIIFLQSLSLIKSQGGIVIHSIKSFYSFTKISQQFEKGCANTIT